MEIEHFDLEKTFRLLDGPIKSFVGQFISMPLGSFAGLSIEQVDASKCIVTLPGGWRTQNPFKSTYWAAQGMAAEMASGVIPMAYVRAAGVPIRMILAGVSGRFVKMCKGPSTFTCYVEDHVKEAMRETLMSGRSVGCNLTSIGHDSTGDTVSEWSFSWSFRARLEEVSSSHPTL
ncbi:MAG: DUF4442 domain-containing protein [Bradymonadia bacterium]